MSNRISKQTREKMAKALVRHRFNDRATELCVESGRLFHAVLDERYDAGTQKLMRQLEKRVPGGLRKQTAVYLRARGMRVTVGEAQIGNYWLAGWTPEVSERLCLNDKDEEPSEQLADQIAAFALETQRFEDQLKEAYSRALGALEQFTTTKKLTEEWPEALPVIGHLLAVEDRALPAVQLEAINDEFGLPPAEMAEAA